jgi:hypothetical protein
MPPLALHIWGWFVELARCRQYGAMGGAYPISYEAIEAWKSVTGASPDPLELKAILALDSAWLDAQPKPKATKA